MVKTDLVLTVADTMAFEVEYKPAGKAGHFLPWQFIETGRLACATVWAIGYYC